MPRSAKQNSTIKTPTARSKVTQKRDKKRHDLPTSAIAYRLLAQMSHEPASSRCYSYTKKNHIKSSFKAIIMKSSHIPNINILFLTSTLETI